MARAPLLWLLFAALISLVSAGAPTFCKCTCFKNSTIIPLDPGQQAKDAASDPTSAHLRRGSLFSPDAADTVPQARTAKTQCSECTKSFCLNQGIDICKDAEEDDVMTLCFQRDSNKDKIIVWGFIVGTCGLLGWALFKHVAKWRGNRTFGRQDMNYTPVSSGWR